MADTSGNIRVSGIYGQFSHRSGKLFGAVCVLLLLLCGFQPIRAESFHEAEVIFAAAETKKIRLAPESALLTSADSAAMQEIRARMDEIRKRRPTVALVLSGGGAKGAAHIGVIRYLETVGIPVDMILGTSMGGLVGGLYALGYNVGELDSLVRNMDWSYALSDRVPREYISYSETKYREKYLLSIPFYYKNTDENDVAKRHGDFKIGADSDKSASELIKNNLIGSLPSGYIFGQNVSNIFSSLSVGYQDSLCFNDLPIPFACVATDLVSGTAKIWHNGKINTALRSTMSIPGVFAPVKIDGMVLVDGGMRDNYPTGLARDMGADIVIGVDLSGGNKKYEEINNLGDIITSGIDMLGRSMYEKNVLQADISIKPELKEYNMMSFDKKNAMFRLKNSLLICRLIEGSYPNYNAVIPAANPNKVLVDRIELMNAIKRVAVCANPTTNLIKMDISGDRISLTAQDLDFYVSANETISCSYEGEPVIIGFKSTFLVEILSNMETPTVLIELADSTRAGVFKPVYDDKRSDSTLMLLMPMIINA